MLDQASPSDLVIDVGMNDGADTAFYLSQGYRVIGIEANPLLVEKAEQRFADAIAQQQLTIIGKGVGPERGTLDFFVNDENDELSSFDQGMAEKLGHSTRVIKVPCIPFADILQECAPPHFIKIDIEGFDLHCLDNLNRDNIPPYISIEAHSLDVLFRLKWLGYQRFKCVNQFFHNQPNSGIEKRNGLGIALGEVQRSFGQMFPIGKQRLVKKIKRRVLPNSHRPRPDGQFPAHSSGPFGEDAPGEWRSAESVAYDWLHRHFEYDHRGSMARRGWYDFHAKAESDCE